MTRALSIALALAIVSMTFAETENRILQHNTDLQLGVHYDIRQDENTIILLQGVPGEVFEFEAIVVENEQYIGPGTIDLVTANDNAGKVELTFVGHNGHPYGAANIMEIRLNQPGVTGVIKALRIAHNLGDLGPIRTGRIEGTCLVENEITNDVYLDSLYGELWCLAGLPSLTVSDPTPGPAGTRILIGEVPFAEPPGGGTTTVPWTWPVTWSICISTTPSRAPSTSAGT